MVKKKVEKMFSELAKLRGVGRLTLNGNSMSIPAQVKTRNE
jgi:hypothetical protein